jgi:hypothetical protein
LETTALTAERVAPVRPATAVQAAPLILRNDGTSDNVNGRDWVHAELSFDFDKYGKKIPSASSAALDSVKAQFAQDTGTDKEDAHPNHIVRVRDADGTPVKASKKGKLGLKGGGPPMNFVKGKGYEKEVKQVKAKAVRNGHTVDQVTMDKLALKARSKLPPGKGAGFADDQAAEAVHMAHQ